MLVPNEELDDMVQQPKLIREVEEKDGNMSLADKLAIVNKTIHDQELAATFLREQETMLNQTHTERNNVRNTDDHYDNHEVHVEHMNQAHTKPIPLTQTQGVCPPDIDFSGTTQAFKEELRNICGRYSECFSTQLQLESAILPPMGMDVTQEAWECKSNRLPPRIQGKVKELEIAKQVQKMQEAKVIRVSTAAAHSQVLLTPKPDGTWRFCVDYRRLNLATKSTQWPIPNVKQMLQRIGSKKPMIFGVLDLTKGYYQAPLSEAAKHYTAFITAQGLYEWNRVPMGLMGAPAYFQRVMTTIVLAGLMYRACEVYMDDIIIYGSSEKEFIANLIAVLERLKKHKITANPQKTKLGMSKVEYVGHRIDQDGISFSRERLEEIIEFETPKDQGELKSFLGLANYVRDHIRDHSTIVAPLNNMLKGYSKRSRRKILKWGIEETQALKEIKDKINACPKLFYVDDYSPIHLYTDASLIGMGAYLCQVKDEKEYPVGFMSMTFNETQKKWNTPERECFAIVMALQKFAYLLRDVRFTLHTDHKNLIYIRDTGSSKVFGWRNQVQQYMMDVVHIKGEENVVADKLSRNSAAMACPDTLEAENELMGESQITLSGESFDIRTPQEDDTQDPSVSRNEECFNAVINEFSIPAKEYDIIIQSTQ